MLHDEPFAALDVTTCYALLRLRADVFVVEQACAYADLDGRDLEPGTRHVWWDEGTGPLAYLRVLTDGDTVRRIGRVATTATARRRGLAARLVGHVVDGTPPGVTLVLAAQAHLQPWYERFGFAVTGPEFIDDGIPHVPMARPSG